MAADLQSRINNLRSKAELLTGRYRMLVQQKQQCDLKVQELEATVKRQQREIEILHQQIENLQVVTTIAPSRENVEHSRAILSQLVRDIDKCIAELTD
jgi:hypothetical protein